MKKLSIALALSILCACHPNDTGHVAAKGRGELIEPPLARIAAFDAMENACGRPAETDSSIERPPYLQRVDATSARVLYTSTGAPEQIELWAPGEDARTIDTAVEGTRYLEGAVQRRGRLAGLSPRTLYCYRLTRDGAPIYGPFGFRTAPAADDPGPVDVLAFGDSGTGSPDQWALREHMAGVPLDLIVHMGDLAYPNGTMAELESTVFDVYAELFSSFSFWPSIGNHDDRTDSAGPYLEVFALPENGAAAGDVERLYSFDWGPIHFVALDTNRMSDAQTEWLDRDLAATDRPWKIVYGHHPPYSSGSHGSSTDVRNRFGPIFERHGVQLVLSGHDHHYERVVPIRGVTYVVTGGGGAGTRRADKREWTVFGEDVLHFVSLRVEGEELRGYAVDATGEVFDSFRISR